MVGQTRTESGGGRGGKHEKIRTFPDSRERETRQGGKKKKDKEMKNDGGRYEQEKTETEDTRRTKTTFKKLRGPKGKNIQMTTGGMIDEWWDT